MPGKLNMRLTDFVYISFLYTTRLQRFVVNNCHLLSTEAYAKTVVVLPEMTLLRQNKLIR